MVSVEIRRLEDKGGVILSRLEVTVDDERRILGPGDAYSFGWEEF